MVLLSLKFILGYLNSQVAMDPLSSDDECALVQLNGSDMALKAMKVISRYLSTHYCDTNFVLFID